MASKSTTNFRSYEAQARLLAAVIATAKPRLDYKEIARHMGSDATHSAIDHRLRPIKQLAKLQEKCVEQGKDPMNLPVEKAEIQKLFGESTPAGLEFHFREVKAIGKAQQDAVSTGGDPTQVTVGTAAKGGKQGKAKTQRSAPSTPATSRKRQAPVNGAATTGGRGRKQVKREPSLDDDIKSDIDSPEENFDELDIQQTPSKFPSRAQRNPAYTVDNSTTNSDLDSPVFHQPYAVTQAENQARAQAMYKPDDFYGKPGDAQGNNGPTPHRSIFGGGDGATWSAGPSHPVAHTTEQSEDELMEIDGSQFSAARKTTNGPPKAATAKRAAATTPKQSKKAIKEDPFEDSTTNTGDFLDLTSTPSKRGGLPLPSSAYPSADQQDDWATSFDDQGDYYGDGEV
ncbi:hypothetical protein PFICI_08068 [Pestalotiopsis fici W106-1]|uniref:Uncharacterized protein n=1 Tax=Pestalotiopsis fici (strain W106-1 / CGMCC3.15140) TaxID=1229662 RepID=W3X3F5_PESFW|nr:uncharacterized protein PFICI_08068 [Pestalotiopsis fici W106-1]ETS80539.1 hypothetical protein PFICI_08068 [Pestalotiopsis fici W106-1]